MPLVWTSQDKQIYAMVLHTMHRHAYTHINTYVEEGLPPVHMHAAAVRGPM